MHPGLLDGLAEERRLQLAEDVRRSRSRSRRRYRSRRMIGLIKGMLGLPPAS